MGDSAAIADDPDELLHQRIQPAVFGANDVGHEADLAVGNNNFPPGRPLIRQRPAHPFLRGIRLDEGGLRVKNAFTGKGRVIMMQGRDLSEVFCEKHT